MLDGRGPWWTPLLALATLGGCSDDPPNHEPPVDETADDDVDLEAPSGDGWQLATGEFPVPVGGEVQRCYFFEVPFDEAAFVNRITITQNDGSHHMNVFRVRTIVQLDAEPGEVVEEGECWTSANWADWPLVANSQSAGTEEWAMPDGVGLRFEPREKIMLQTHYVNATTQVTPLAGKVFVNFHTLAEADVVHELGTMFATNQGIEVCPGEVNRHFEATCVFPTEEPVTITAANGHFHSRGRKFTMSTWDSTTGAAAAPFYENFAWDDPHFGKNLEIEIPPGHGVTYACDFTAARDDCGDPDNDCCFTFGGFVEYQEHCNAFLYYYPRLGGTDINCF